MPATMCTMWYSLVKSKRIVCSVCSAMGHSGALSFSGLFTQCKAQGAPSHKVHFIFSVCFPLFVSEYYRNKLSNWSSSYCFGKACSLRPYPTPQHTNHKVHLLITLLNIYLEHMVVGVGRTHLLFRSGLGFKVAPSIGYM
jgi:hypothetical protein